MKKSIILIIILIITNSLYSQNLNKWPGDKKIDIMELELYKEERINYYPTITMYGDDSLDFNGNIIYSPKTDYTYYWKDSSFINYSGIAYINYPNGKKQYETYLNDGEIMYDYSRCWDINNNLINCEYFLKPFEEIVPKMNFYNLDDVQYISTFVGADTIVVSFIDEEGGDSISFRITNEFQDLAYYNDKKITGVVFENYLNKITKNAYYIIDGVKISYIEYYINGKFKKYLNYYRNEILYEECYDRKGKIIECN